MSIRTGTLPASPIGSPGYINQTPNNEHPQQHTQKSSTIEGIAKNGQLFTWIQNSTSNSSRKMAQKINRKRGAKSLHNDLNEEEGKSGNFPSNAFQKMRIAQHRITKKRPCTRGGKKSRNKMKRKTRSKRRRRRSLKHQRDLSLIHI